MRFREECYDVPYSINSAAEASLQRPQTRKIPSRDRVNEMGRRATGRIEGSFRWKPYVRPGLQRPEDRTKQKPPMPAVPEIALISQMDRMQLSETAQRGRKSPDLFEDQPSIDFGSREEGETSKNSTRRQGEEIAGGGDQGAKAVAASPEVRSETSGEPKGRRKYRRASGQ